MVYGILQLLNFAHGDVYMVGAFIGYGMLALLVPASIPLLPALLTILLMLAAAMLGCGFSGRGHRMVRLPAAAQRAAESRR